MQKHVSIHPITFASHFIISFQTSSIFLLPRGARARWLYVAAYVVVWAAYALMVKASKENGHYPYNLFSCTLIIECVKLGLAYAYYRHLKQRNPGLCIVPLRAVQSDYRASYDHYYGLLIFVRL